MKPRRKDPCWKTYLIVLELEGEHCVYWAVIELEQEGDPSVY